MDYGGVGYDDDDGDCFSGHLCDGDGDGHGVCGGDGHGVCVGNGHDRDSDNDCDDFDRLYILINYTFRILDSYLF